MQQVQRRIRINIIRKTDQQKIQPNGEISITPSRDSQIQLTNERLALIEDDLLSAVHYKGRKAQQFLQYLGGSSIDNKTLMVFLEKIDQNRLRPMIQEYQKQLLEKYKLSEWLSNKISQYFKNNELLVKALQNQLSSQSSHLIINTRHQFFEMINFIKLNFLRRYTQLVALYLTATDAKGLCEISRQMVEQNRFCLSHTSLIKNQQSRKIQFSLPEEDVELLLDLIEYIECSTFYKPPLNFRDAHYNIETKLNFLLLQISGGSFSLIDIVPLRLSEIHSSKNQAGIYSISNEQKPCKKTK